MKRGTTTLGLALLAGLLALSTSARAQTERGVIVEGARNDDSSFMVRVAVDRPERTYRVGDTMQVTVSSERDGFLYLLYLDAGNTITCLYPNAYQSDNRIAAGNPSVTIPQFGAAFRLRIAPPTGKEVLKAIVSTEQIPQAQLQSMLAGKGSPFASLSKEQVKAVNVELSKQSPGAWAEHFVEITTQAAEGGGSVPIRPDPDPVKARRVGLFIGISQFQDQRIPTLTVADKDAQAMAESMRQLCRLDEVQVLLNDQATRSNIEQSICQWLPSKANAGDTIVLYWSGHGGRCADTSGRHSDGYAEYLVPHDGSLENADLTRKTMVLDDAFGRWLQFLDGRRVAIILDTCHSGGQAEEGRKGVKGVRGPLSDGEKRAFRFLQRNLTRSKDIGHKEMALLASSTAKQVSFERREGDLSVMTYFLVEQFRSSAGPLGIKEAHEALKDKVARYVEANFPGADQTPVLVDYSTPPLYLRP